MIESLGLSRWISPYSDEDEFNSEKYSRADDTSKCWIEKILRVCFKKYGRYDLKKKPQKKKLRL